jgi:hypothetical protein
MREMVGILREELCGDVENALAIASAQISAIMITALYSYYWLSSQLSFFLHH